MLNTTVPYVLMGLDYILIDDLQLSMVIGLLDWERNVAQPVSVQVRLYPLMQPYTHQQDQLGAHSVDYAQAVALIQQCADNLQPQLVESFAEHCITQLFDHLPIGYIELWVKKTKVLPETAGVGVYLCRQRNNSNLSAGMRL